MQCKDNSFLCLSHHYQVYTTWLLLYCLPYNLCCHIQLQCIKAHINSDHTPTVPEQSTMFCSLSGSSIPVDTAYAPSMAPVTLNA